VIYLDSSVAFARLLFEPRSPAAPFWQERSVSSRLLEYKVRNRVHAYGLISSHAEPARLLARALEPWPMPLRTLDALHLATVEFLRAQGEPVELASYDNRFLAAARALGIPIAA